MPPPPAAAVAGVGVVRTRRGTGVDDVQGHQRRIRHERSEPPAPEEESPLPSLLGRRSTPMELAAGARYAEPAGCAGSNCPAPSFGRAYGYLAPAPKPKLA